jgi:hypothetical protein
VGFCGNGNENSSFTKDAKLLGKLNDYQFLRNSVSLLRKLLFQLLSSENISDPSYSFLQIIQIH